MSKEKKVTSGEAKNESEVNEEVVRKVLEQANNGELSEEELESVSGGNSNYSTNVL